MVNCDLGHSFFIAKGCILLRAASEKYVSFLPLTEDRRPEAFFCFSHGQNIIFLSQLGENAFFLITPRDDRSVFNPRGRKNNIQPLAINKRMALPRRVIYLRFGPFFIFFAMCCKVLFLKILFLMFSLISLLFLLTSNYC